MVAPKFVELIKGVQVVPVGAQAEDTALVGLIFSANERDAGVLLVLVPS